MGNESIYPSVAESTDIENAGGLEDKLEVNGVVKYADVPPSAASFVESLRDIGYSLKHAIADIVDNSV